MAAEKNSQKVKLLKLMELIRRETDEDHPISRKELCRRLVDMGISCDIRTLSKDIKALNDYGFEVLEYYRNHEKFYYSVEAQGFSVPEIKILIDCVQAASFITEKKTEELIGKIASLGGSHKAEILQSNMVCFNTRKHSNEKIYYNVDAIENALQEKKRVSFLYFDLNEKREKTYRRDKWRYKVDPLALVFNEDNYYLMTYHTKRQDIVNYRVDRMDAVEISDEDICDAAASVIAKQDFGEYTEQVFKMYNGETQTVTLRFSDKLTGVVFDKFGEDTKMIKASETEIAAEVKVKESPVFYSWVFQFGKDMTIVAPDKMVAEFKKMKEESL